MLRFLINIDRSKDRLNRVSNRLKEMGVAFERVSAVDGRSLTSEQLKKITLSKDDARKIGCPRDLLPGEVGCYLSHLKCWERLIKSDARFALILEDDIDISDRAKLFMQSSDWIPSGCQLIQLHGDICCKARVRRKTISVGVDGELVRQIKPIPVCTWAYIISREAAQYAINNSKYILAPVDDFMASPYFSFSKKYEIWKLDPCVVTTNGDATTIGCRKIKYKINIYTQIRRKIIKLMYKANLLDCVGKILRYK